MPTLNQLWNEQQALLDKCQQNQVAIGQMFGFGSMPAQRSTTTATKASNRATGTRNRNTTRSRATRGNGAASQTQLQQLVEAAARQHGGSFTPSQLIARYDALKGQRPNIIGRALQKVPGATQTGNQWTYQEPAQRQAA